MYTLTVTTLFLTNVHLSDQTIVLPSSCRDLPDGTHWIKLLDGDDYPPLQIQCSNGYSILNVDTDTNLINYFSSWIKWHYAIAGPVNGDPVNWSQWYLPDDGSTEYLVSPSCDVCDITDTENNDLSTDTTYYMTGNLFGCWWTIRGLHDCDMNWDSYECLACECDNDGCHGTSISDSTSQTGICATNTRSSTAEVATTHDLCTAYTDISYKPSIGTDGRFCACVKPSSTQYFEVSAAELIDNIDAKQIEDDITNIDDVYELYQKDFKTGTYRIMKSGTYKIMEDITFDFNAGISNEDGAWMPRLNQIDDYPGATQFRDPYFMGFFAGITVETDNVIIDLNGYTLKQSQAFYYQQRWFSLIELANQPFMPGQGPGFFGGDPVPANNVEIKNGVMGLTSHHAIHGNRNKIINIHDLVIENFETHGIQLNGFENLEITNVEIKHSSQQAYLLGEYGHARMLLPRLRLIAEENPTETIKFTGRNNGVSMAEIADEMEKQINMAFEYVMYGTVYDQEDEEYGSWLKAKETFINDDGIPYGSSMYGIFLSYYGSNVFGYHHSNLYSHSVKIQNVQVHGLRHKMQEYLRFHSDLPFYVNPFNAVFDLDVALDQTEDLSTSKYVGNIMTDAYLAMNKMSDNWGYLQMQQLQNDGLVAWSVGLKSLAEQDLTLTCNADVMTHSGKGIAGFRVDGVQGVEISNLEVYNLFDYTPLGSGDCGAYSEGGHNLDGGHFLQTLPMQTGFSGHMVQGITVDFCEITQFEDISVHDIGSANGVAFGLSVWQGTDLEVTGDVNTQNIRAGFMLDTDELSYNSRPNAAPESCGIRVYWEYSANKATITHTDGDIQTNCVAGHVGCFNIDEFGGSMMGVYTECDGNEYGHDYEYLNNFDRTQLETKDTSKDLNTFESTSYPMDPGLSEELFSKLFSGSNNYIEVKTKASFTNNHINVNQYFTKSINISHLVLLLTIPIFAFTIYNITSKLGNNNNSNNGNTVKSVGTNILYTKLPTVSTVPIEPSSTKPNYGTL